MFPPKYLEPKEVYQGELLVPGHWVTAFVSGPMAWPTKPQKVRFAGQNLFIIPIMKEHAPGVTMRLGVPGMTAEDGQRIIMRLLSCVSWVEGKGVVVEYFMGGGRPSQSQRQDRFGITICDNFDLSYLPEPVSTKAQLGLALMREGRGLNHPAYAFLSFYRVLEVAFPDGRKRGEWMDGCIERITEHRAKQVIDRLKAEVADIGKHLQQSGRQAVAHAREEPIVNPDDPEDVRRLSSERALMEALAEHAIEEELGVETPSTVYKKHLYELAGFKSFFGEKAVARITVGESISENGELNIPPINIELRRSETFEPLRNLQVIRAEQDREILRITWLCVKARVQFRCTLDFGAERLHFDISHDFAKRDDGTSEGAAALAEIVRFENEYFGNGELRIVNAEDGSLLSRKDAFMPVNCFLNFDVAKAEVENWKKLAEQRARA